MTVALQYLVSSAVDGPFGSSLTSAHYADEGARVIRLGNIGDGFWRDEDAAFVPVEYAKQLARHEARPGDVVVAGLGDANNPLGRAAMVPDIGAAIVKADCFRLRLLSERLDVRFFVYFMSARGTELARERAHGSTRQRLPLGEVLRIPVPVPPLDEQRRIVDYLDIETTGIDTLLAKNEEATALAEERELAVIVDRVTGGVEATPVGGYGSSFWINTKRSGWTVCALGLRYRVELGKMLNAERADDPEGRRYLGNSNVRWDDFDLADVKTMTFTDTEWPRYGLEPGDVLVCEGGDVGRAAVWDGRVPSMHYQKALHRLRPLRSEDEPRYLMFAMMAAARTGVFAIGSNKATIDHLTGEKLAEHRFPFPPPSEQREIVRDLDRALDASRSIRNKLERQRHLLRERRQAVITAAVTGEINV